jgi:peptide chain release factor 2
LTNSNGTTIRSASKLCLCGAIFDAPAKKAELDATEAIINDPNFWNDPSQSQKIMQQRKRLEEVLGKDSKIAGSVSDIETYLELGHMGEDVATDLAREIKQLRTYLDDLESDMLMSGENDHRGAIVTIHPGAGGTESQDWAEMLMRMYLRWAERNGVKATVTDILDGDGAGIKSATIEMEGDHVYGRMTSEVGVHRLVRISPFDANARRHTSFSSVFAIPLIDDDINIEIKSEDVKIDVYRAGGAGGQHVNRTESAVRMTHLPSGIVVQCQNERSQHQNRAAAMKQLKARLYEWEMEKKRKEQKQLEDSKMDINFGSQIRSYVLAPYRLVKDHRTKLAIGDVDRVLDGDMAEIQKAFLVWRRTGKTFGDDKDAD